MSEEVGVDTRDHDSGDSGNHSIYSRLYRFNIYGSNDCLWQRQVVVEAINIEVVARHTGVAGHHTGAASFNTRAATAGSNLGPEDLNTGVAGLNTRAARNNTGMSHSIRSFLLREVEGIKVGTKEV